MGVRGKQLRTNASKGRWDVRGGTNGENKLAPQDSLSDTKTVYQSSHLLDNVYTQKCFLCNLSFLFIKLETNKDNSYHAKYAVQEDLNTAAPAAASGGQLSDSNIMGMAKYYSMKRKTLREMRKDEYVRFVETCIIIPP